MMSFFDFRTFIRIARKSFFPVVGDLAQLTHERIVFLIAFFVIFPICQIFNAVCFKLDDILYPDHKLLKIKQPVFILGNPRSGTTYMHRLLALDKKRYFFFKTWEIMFPAICQKKILAALGRLDNRLGGAGYRFIINKEKQTMSELSKVHPSGLFLPEECELLFIHIFSSYNLLFLFPFKDEFQWFIHFDELLSVKEKKRIMDFYIECIRRHAYYKKHEGQFLSKSPAFSSKIESLLKYFPDGKIIYMVRSPLEVIPSIFSLVQEFYRSAIHISPDEEILAIVYHIIKEFYDYPLAKLETKSASSYFIANYEHLTKSPLNKILELYDCFGYEMHAQYRELLNREEENASKYISRHSYSLEQYDLTQERILHDFIGIFDRFKFDRQLQK